MSLNLPGTREGVADEVAPSFLRYDSPCSVLEKGDILFRMNRAFLLIALFLAIGIGTYHYLQPRGATTDLSGGKPATLDIGIEARKMDPPIVRVAQGSSVTFLINTDETGAIHIDGYEVTTSIAVGRTSEVKFVAATPGTFDIHIRPASNPNAEILIGTLLVDSPQRAW